MLHSVKELENATLSATDGQIGHIKDVYFDDALWGVRYLVVNSGFWLTGRKVLISPISLRKPDWQGKTFPAAITKEQVKNSPDINTDKPISRQNEEQYLDYFGYPFYWGGTSLWGNGLFPIAMEPDYPDYERERLARSHQIENYSHIQHSRRNDDDPHLRSCKEVTNYKLIANDGEIGHVCDFLIDEKTWSIAYVVVETSHWWSGHKVLIAPEWITGVHWPNQSVSVDLSQASVKESPAYDPRHPVDRDLEINLYRHYKRHGYWAETTPEGASTVDLL